MKKQTYHTLKAGVILSLSLLACFSCSDKWDDHYDVDKNITSDETLWQQICCEPNLSDFMEVLQATKTFRKHDKTTVSYADLLNGDQVYTVWAPVNGTFNKDSLLTLCETAAGDSLVEKTFVKSHIARYTHSVSSLTEKKVRTLNQKNVSLTNTSFSNVTMVSQNNLAKNGILHTVSSAVPYPYTIYEHLCSFDYFAGIRDYYLTYHEEELDEYASVVEGINEEGMTVYVDSVMVEKNILFGRLGYINAEDSTYWMIAPTNEGWNAAYQEAMEYFDYGSLDKADSLQQYYAKYALLTDGIFNRNLQKSPEDSLRSKPYNPYSARPQDYVFYRPFDEGGILSNYEEEISCSNGILYKTKEWPFSVYETYFKPVVVEGEYATSSTYLKSYSLCSFKSHSLKADSISNNAYLEITPATSTSQWEMVYNIPNTLAGTYDVYVVIIPRIAHDPNADPKDIKKTKFKAWIAYNDKDGKVIEQAIPETFENDKDRVDSIRVATVSLPTCNYDQEKVTVTVKIKCTVASKEIVNYTRNIFLDCICLLPHKEE